MRAKNILSALTRSGAVSIAFALSYAPALAQNDIEDVIVETYYISDANDAQPTDGGTMAEGSTTYRVFLDLRDSCSLLEIYGDTAHPLEISSTAHFFNYGDGRGRSFGHEINNGALDEGTLAVDSWLSVGGASNSRFGILKADDPDMASLEIFPHDLGLMANEDPLAGIPLSAADGLVEDTSMSVLPPNFFVTGISPDSVFLDTTQASSFLSDSTKIRCLNPGVQGPTPDNRILIAQLTTTGALTFHLNIRVLRPGGEVVTYVATDTLLFNGESPNGLLSYPPVCGCTDPDYLEFDPAAGCDDGSCATAIVFGCLDTNACNFNPDANFNFSALCCYGPDSCNGLDVNIVCPGIGFEEPGYDALRFEAFPNPVRDFLQVRLDTPHDTDGLYFLLDRSGRVLRHDRLVDQNNSVFRIDMSDLSRGVYLLRVLIDGEHRTRLIVKT